ncbi:TonB-dependent receptor [Pseudomonas sp. MM211]|uniref:TonB-dependent siderophore receptor n=1 Tax=Pseudomonas sp. MM211 TaxID=2866808 RepID=UPI001CED8958|nr:TonB-dependent receptor [Pseudomonas sp. MM211]UCJ14943.1 TonB-dependent receptor [Pseudomonas sp. MM211]
MTRTPHTRFHGKPALSLSLRTLACLTLLGGAPLALAQSTDSVSPSETSTTNRLNFNIPAQSLTAALGSFGSQSGVQVSYEAALTEGLSAPAVNGTLSVEEAIARLLQGSGLGWSLTPERTLLLFRQEPVSSLMLSPSTISASGELPESAYGAVQGYRATRTATGTKTDTALRDVPQSVQVVSRRVIEDQQISSLGDALANVSGIQRGNSHGSTTESFHVRGFLATTYAVDGMMTNSQVVRPEVLSDLANIERVEVLKGPASVLYGRGNPGGLINLVTRKPTFEPQAEIKAQAGSWDFYRLQSYVSGALDPAETLAGGLAMAWQTDGGYRHTFHDRTRNYIAPTLRWQPSDSTTVDVGFEYTELKGPYDRGLLVIGNRVDSRQRVILEEPLSYSETNKAAFWIKTEHQANDWLTLRQATKIDDSRKDFQNINFQGLQADGRTLNRRPTDYSEDIDSISAQFEAVADFNTGGLQHTALLGYEYVTGNREARIYRGVIAPIDIYEPVYGAQPENFQLSSTAKQKMHSHSLYLQDQIALNEQWKLLGGARWDSVVQKMNTIENGTSDAFELTPEALSPRIGVVYQPQDWLSLYASYSRSFSPQTDRTRNNVVLDPETGKQYEIGAKLELIPERLSATLALFEITRQNVSADDPADDDFSIQTGEQRVRGIELDVSGEPVDGWNLIGNIAVMDAKLTKDPELRIGARLEAVPVLSGSLWNSYQLQSGAWQGLGFGAGVVFAGKRYGNIENSYSVSGYVRFDASVFYDVTEQVRVSLNGQNLTDIRYVETISSANAYPGDPASVVASVSARF